MVDIENNPDKPYKIDFTGIEINIKKSAFKNKKNIKIFNFIDKLGNKNGVLDIDELFGSKTGFDFQDLEKTVITQKEIQNFILHNKLDTKSITEEDVKSFLIETKRICEEEKEKKFNSSVNLEIKDENGNDTITNNVRKGFSDNKEKIPLLNESTVYNTETGEVKSGFEIFDLNDDGKIDDIERKIFQKPLNYDRIKNFYINIDKSDSSENVEDGVVTKQGKQNYYNKLEQEYLKSQYDKLFSKTFTDADGKEIFTKQLKSLFIDRTTGLIKKEVAVEELTDSNGKIKQGLEIFDLNNDGKLDNKELDYFTNNGRITTKPKNVISLTGFSAVIEELDFFKAEEKKGNFKDSKILNTDKQSLYKIIDGTYAMFENLSFLPPETLEQYKEAISGTQFLDYKSKSAIGASSDMKIKVDTQGLSRYELASIIVHETTHSVLKKYYNVDKLAQEIATFYMEYKLYQNSSQKPDFTFGQGKAVVIDSFYADSFKRLKEENPQMSEYNIAKKLFFDFHYESYADRYYDSTLKSKEMVNNYHAEWPKGLFDKRNS